MVSETHLWQPGVLREPASFYDFLRYGGIGPTAYWQKPPYSYIALITMAISSRADRKMTLNQVNYFTVIKNKYCSLGFYLSNEASSYKKGREMCVW